MENEYKEGQLVKLVAQPGWPQNWRDHDGQICRIIRAGRQSVDIVALNRDNQLPNEPAYFGSHVVSPL